MIEPPLSLYVHFPWCIRKCPYCDFNSHEITNNTFPESEYIDALIRDLDYEATRIKKRQINSIFFGGGTPSLFSGNALERLLTGIHSRFLVTNDIEITLEANPGTAEAQRFCDYRSLGINRLSIGVQSFHNRQLKRIGRIHDKDDALKAISLAHAAGFENINVDIMFGLPEQSVDEALIDLKTAIKQSPTHISWYQLTIEPNTLFHKRPPSLPDDECCWEMQQQGTLYLTEKGFNQYETSAYSVEAYRCAHNLNYWQFGDYLGIGAGAHGKLTDVSTTKVMRYARHRIPQSYINRAGTDAAITREKQLNQADAILEFMLNALRLTSGIHPGLFQARTGLSIASVKTRLEKARESGLIEWTPTQLKPTMKGQYFLNELLQFFIDSPEKQTATAGFVALS